MSKVYRVYEAGANSLSAQCATPLRVNPVVGNKLPPKRIALHLPARFLGGKPTNGTYMSSLCKDLRVFGCNVNPYRTGTTKGDRKIVSVRVKPE